MKTYRNTTKTLVRSMCNGNGPMGATQTDYYKTKDGEFIRHSWGMGGEDWDLVTQQEAEGEP
jgi:hypothetical protein